MTEAIVDKSKLSISSSILINLLGREFTIRRTPIGKYPGIFSFLRSVLPELFAIFYSVADEAVGLDGGVAEGITIDGINRKIAAASASNEKNKINEIISSCLSLFVNHFDDTVILISSLTDIDKDSLLDSQPEEIEEIIRAIWKANDGFPYIRNMLKKNVKQETTAANL